ncbi:MAG TPA: transglutaminase-like domain-containing protein [Syntrophorhabdus sp.]|nr:transglutaminase-like domain-containing protein [Syntrophorhabdus sp.]
MIDFLEPTFFIDCDEAIIKEKSQELAGCSNKDLEKALRIFYFVRDQIRYNVYSSRSADSDFKASHILKKGEGYCVQKAVLLVALARAVHIPARLRFAEIRIYETARSLAEKRGSNVFPCHGLTDLYVDGRWVKATPTYNLEYCRKAGIAPVEFNGQSDALLPLTTVDGKPNVEYIEDYGFFHDLPLEQIRKASASWKYIKD